jgi:CRISPR-associated protein Csb2
MFALAIRYLNGFAAAATTAERDQVEWPPHPGRVFMALAAGHYHTGEDAAEREVLLWLENLQDPPHLYAPEALQRAVVTQFVPVNPRLEDEKKQRTKEKKDGKRPPPPLQSAEGIIRTRQPRTFTRAWLTEDTVYLMWPGVDLPESLGAACASLCGKVTRIGHSSSMVQITVVADGSLPPPNWLPDEAHSTQQLRLASAGTLDLLEASFKREDHDLLAELMVMHAGARNPQSKAEREFTRSTGRLPPMRLRPELSVFQGYAPSTAVLEEPVARESVFSPQFLVFTLDRIDGPYRCLDLGDVLIVSQIWRRALISHANAFSSEVRSILSGHHSDGTPLEEPHLAFLPVGFVGHPHADGRLMGIGLGLPRSLPERLRREALRAISAVKELTLGRLGKWRMTPLASQRPPVNLQFATWTAAPSGATHWATLTPVAYDHHPKAKEKLAYLAEIAEMVETACERTGLPRPREVVVTTVSAHLGAPPAHVFPRLQRKDGSERRHTHAILVFDEPVCGPMLIGAGRYRGYGLCRPMELSV